MFCLSCILCAVGLFDTLLGYWIVLFHGAAIHHIFWFMVWSSMASVVSLARWLWPSWPMTSSRKGQPDGCLWFLLASQTTNNTLCSMGRRCVWLDRSSVFFRMRHNTWRHISRFLVCSWMCEGVMGTRLKMQSIYVQILGKIWILKTRRHSTPRTWWDFDLPDETPIDVGSFYSV